MTDPHTLQASIARQEQQLANNKARLAALQRDCKHPWGETEYTPDIREAYHDPGDPEGTMGIDRRLPFYVPRQETKKWTRTCPKCGKTETTTRTDKKVQETPRF